MSHLDVQKYICYENDIPNILNTGSHKNYEYIMCSGSKWLEKFFQLNNEN